ncbi:hypothetical protein [Microcoleus sp. S13C4]|uniref:hypothetical protein n=1 Tax=Microcoleus sp. S13C4 TaxID=3055410 RepID=UPI002FD68551
MNWLRELREIPAALPSSDSQDRLRGVTVQRKCDSAVALAMLVSKVNDAELMVRDRWWRWDGGIVKLRTPWLRC